VPGKPFQSKLNPFLREIYELRSQAPPVSYQEIARLLKERHDLQVSANGIFSFVKARSRPRAVYAIAPAFVVHGPGVRPVTAEPSPAPQPAPLRRPRYNLGEDF
jgi:hypothetical protein